MTYVKLEDTIAAVQKQFPYAAFAMVPFLQSLPTVSDGWEDIATAPRDGSTFITYSPPFHEGMEGHVDTAGWMPDKGEFWKGSCGWDSVTHWRPLNEPLPAPPSATLNVTEQQSELLNDALVDSLTDLQPPIRIGIRAERTGKQVFLNGEHVADATTEDHGKTIVDALNGGTENG